MEAGVIQRATESGAPRRRPSVAKTWLKAIELTSQIEAEPHRLFADVVEDWAQRQPGRPALLSDGQSFTYGELAARINRYARWALSLGIRTGYTVCLLMPNRPDYLACWLGISRVGGTVALINTRLVGRSLAHCIDVAQRRSYHPCRRVHGCVRDRTSASESRAANLEPRCRQRRRRSGCGARGSRTPARCPPPNAATSRSMDARSSDLHLGHHGPAEGGEHQPSPHSQLGLAGLPASRTLPSDDRLYDCLPLHHSVGGIVAPCSMLRAGGSVVIAEKFSATNFWDDIVRLDCTVFQYIGELCRYLLKAPPSGLESRTPPAARRRQRIARRHLGGVRRAVRDSAHPRILRRDGRQFFAVQRRRQARRDRPDSAAAGASLSRRSIVKARSR